MKTRILFSTILLFCTASALAQSKQDFQRVITDSILTRIDSILQESNAMLEEIEITNSLRHRYKLYKTNDPNILLELDTQTGKIEQIQWASVAGFDSIKSINDTDLTSGKGFGTETFELYPTESKFIFILLNKVTGQKWIVQWGALNTNRWIRKVD